MLTKLLAFSYAMLKPKQKKLSMDYDSLVGMSMNINREIKEKYRMKQRMEKLIFYDNRETGGGLAYEVIFKPFD